MLREKQREITITKQDLIDFEDNVVSEFEKGKIRGAVHLSNNNENQLIEIFQYIRTDDWVFSTWRNHYHALLHGVPKEELMNEILNSHSISFQSPEHHFFTSAIVTGILPIAVGTALALKWKNSERIVFCFVGDMTAESGAFYECLKYSVRNNLPIHFIIEDNGLSTNTPTQEVWGKEGYSPIWDEIYNKKYVTKYSYVRGKFPHVGIGKFIYF